MIVGDDWETGSGIGGVSDSDGVINNYTDSADGRGDNGDGDNNSGGVAIGSGDRDDDSGGCGDGYYISYPASRGVGDSVGVDDDMYTYEDGDDYNAMLLIMIRILMVLMLMLVLC